ncbi:MAG: G5 domain-containing protein [Peptococcaceae bacterium]|nr:G5 domain-containing protein [Peptococcaceae bacterium]
MSNIKNYEPIFGTWFCDTVIGDGTFGQVCKVRTRQKRDGTVEYAAIKIIRCLHKNDMERMRNKGMNEYNIRAYAQFLAQSINEETMELGGFRDNPYVVPYRNATHKKHDKTGWDLMLLMDLHTNLYEHICQNKMTQYDVIRMGIDICKGLERYHNTNQDPAVKNKLRNKIKYTPPETLLHLNIKPSNIFYSQGTYLLGDLSLAQPIERAVNALSRRGSPLFLAPEVARGNESDETLSCNSTADTYSLGLVMYWILNGCKYPFMPEGEITQDALRAALEKRLEGEELPWLKGVGKTLNKILQDACAVDRPDRYDSAVRMRKALEGLMPEVKSESSDMFAGVPGMTDKIGIEMPANQVPEGALSANWDITMGDKPKFRVDEIKDSQTVDFSVVEDQAGKTPEAAPEAAQGEPGKDTLIEQGISPAILNQATPGRHDGSSGQTGAGSQTELPGQVGAARQVEPPRQAGPGSQTESSGQIGPGSQTGSPGQVDPPRQPDATPRPANQSASNSANNSANNTGMAKSDGGVPDETDAPDTAPDTAKETSQQYNRVEHRDTPKKKSKKKPLIAAGIILALLAALGAGYGLGLFRPLTDMISNLGTKDNPQIAFGIRAAGESDIDVVLSNRAAADDVLDRFKAYYEDLVKGVAEKILSTEIEEAVEVVELRVNEQLEVVGIVAEMGELEGIGTPGTDADPNENPNANPNENPNAGLNPNTDPDSNIEESPKARVTGINEAVDALIEGKKTTIKHPAAEGETVKDIAELYKEDNITAEAILEANRGLILITADGEAEELTAATKLPEGTEIKVVVTRPYFHVKVVWVGEETEEIAFETQTVKDDQLTLHTTEVKQEGEKGSKTISYDYISRNGVVVESIHRGEKVVKEAVDRVVLEGTAPKVENFTNKGITDSKLAEMVQKGEISRDVTTLYLNDNQITDITPLESLTGLTELHLNYNKITNFAKLQSLSNLRLLSLQKNNIIDTTSLGSLKSLHSLNLAANDIIEFSSLKKLTNLKELNIKDNAGVGVLEPKAIELQKSLPNCKIIYQ